MAIPPASLPPLVFIVNEASLLPSLFEICLLRSLRTFSDEHPCAVRAYDPPRARANHTLYPLLGRMEVKPE